MSQGAALQIQGSRESGQDVRGQNVTAVAAIANIVKSSLGPVGLDKVSITPQLRRNICERILELAYGSDASGRHWRCNYHK